MHVLDHRYIEYVLIPVLGCILGLNYFVAGENFSLLLVGIVVGTVPVFLNALRSIVGREWASMDTLASVALIFSIIEHEFPSTIFIALMLAAARLLEKHTTSRMEKNLRSLMKLKPTTAKVESGGAVATVPIVAVHVGDLVVVDAGERIPVDGIVVVGEGAVDESALTGESLPVDKGTHDTVSSSTLLASGSLTIETTRIGKDTTLEHIIALVESSREEKPSIETFGQKFGKFYLAAIFFGSALIYIITGNTSLVLSVVLVVCADDIAVAIPLTYLRAIGIAAKRGVVIKGGKHLEVLENINTIVFDKTGTLTRGKPHIAHVMTSTDVSEEYMLQHAVPLALRSKHPLSRALVRYALTKGVEEPEAESAEVIGGKGIVGIAKGKQVIVGNRKLLDEHSVDLESALHSTALTYEEEGKTITFVAIDKKVVGILALGDEVKSDAAHVIERLRALGIKEIVMLSGDNERAASDIARSLNINRCYANLLPEDKVEKIKELSLAGVTVMVGDGVNDAAALSLAHVGIAMGGLGSDGAIESANIVLMHDNLSAIPDTIVLARNVHKISIEDFCIWGITNIFGLILVFTYTIGPAGAAAYNFVSDFFPLINSLRVTGRRR